MEYRKFGDAYIVRLDRDEEILAQLKIFAEKEQVKLASVTGLGAVKDFTVGVFDSSAKAYKSNRFQGVYEIVSLVGTINTMNDAFYCHLHMCAAFGRRGSTRRWRHPFSRSCLCGTTRQGPSGEDSVPQKRKRG